TKASSNRMQTNPRNPRREETKEGRSEGWYISMLSDDVEEFSGNHYDTLDGTAFKEAGDRLVGSRLLLDIGFGRALGHQNGAPQLAVNLKHKFYFVCNQCSRIHFGPRCIEYVSQTICKTQVTPQLPGYMRYYRVKHSQQNAQCVGHALTRDGSVGQAG